MTRRREGIVPCVSDFPDRWGERNLVYCIKNSKQISWVKEQQIHFLILYTMLIKYFSLLFNIAILFIIVSLYY